MTWLLIIPFIGGLMLKATKAEGKSVKYTYVNEEDDVDGEVILHFMKKNHM